MHRPSATSRRSEEALALLGTGWFADVHHQTEQPAPVPPLERGISLQRIPRVPQNDSGYEPNTGNALGHTADHGRGTLESLQVYRIQFCL